MFPTIRVGPRVRPLDRGLIGVLKGRSFTPAPDAAVAISDATIAVGTAKHDQPTVIIPRSDHHSPVAN